jgi:MFS family permease
MGIISGIITGRFAEFFGKFKMIIVGLILQVAAISLTAFVNQIFLILAGIIFLRFAFYLCEPILTVLLNRQLSDGIRASIISLVNLIASLIMIFSRPLIGLVASNYTIITGFKIWFFTGIVFLLISGYLLWTVKNKTNHFKN